MQFWQDAFADVEFLHPQSSQLQYLLQSEATSFIVSAFFLMENLVSVHFKCLYGLIHFRENNLNYEQDYTFGVALHNCSNTILYKVHKCTEYSMLLSV